MAQLRNNLTLKLIEDVYEKATDQLLVLNGCEFTAKAACVSDEEELTLSQHLNLPILADECQLLCQWIEVNNHRHCLGIPWAYKGSFQMRTQSADESVSLLMTTRA